MATLVSKYSLVEQARRLDPEGKLALIAETLNLKTGMILEEAPWQPANDTWTNKTVRRASLPTGTKRKLNSGIPTSVSRTTEIMDVMCMIGDYAEYDKDWIDSFPNPSTVRLQEASAYIQGIGQSLVSSIIYANANKDPDDMHGLEPRLNVLDGEFVIDGGGTGSDLTSFYVINWSPTDVYLMYPKNNAELGITHQDLGEVTLTDATTAAPNTSQYQGYRDYFQVKCGLVVRNPRAIGRVANIESAGTSNTFNEDDLIALLNNMDIGPNARIYCNQTMLTQGQIALKDKLNVTWTAETGLSGMPMMSFQGIPVRKIDKQILLNTESAIT